MLIGEVVLLWFCRPLIDIKQRKRSERPSSKCVSHPLKAADPSDQLHTRSKLKREFQMVSINNIFARVPYCSRSGGATETVVPIFIDTETSRLAFLS